jgi:hypothetical protein
MSLARWLAVSCLQDIPSLGLTAVWVRVVVVTKHLTGQSAATAGKSNTISKYTAQKNLSSVLYVQAIWLLL